MEQNRTVWYQLQYFSTSNFYVATISLSLHAIIWWELTLYLLLMCMYIILGSMYVELSELTA